MMCDGSEGASNVRCSPSSIPRPLSYLLLCTDSPATLPFAQFLLHSVLCGACVNERSVMRRKGCRNGVHFLTCETGTGWSRAYYTPSFTKINDSCTTKEGGRTSTYCSVPRYSIVDRGREQCSLPRSTIHALQGERESARSWSPLGNSIVSGEKKGFEIGRKPKGVFMTMKKGSTWHTEGTKGKRKTERLWQNHIVWVCAHVRETMRQPDMCGTTSPIQDFTEAAWEKTTMHILRWRHVVVPPELIMDFEGKEYPFMDKSHTFKRMEMPRHEHFNLLLASMPATEEEKRCALLQCMELSKQVKHVSRVVEDIKSDVMVTSVDNDGKRNAQISESSVQCTRNEMEDRSSETKLLADNVACLHISTGRASVL